MAKPHDLEVFMSNPGDTDTTPVESVAQLAAFIAEGCKPPARFSIGTEHEKFGFRHDDLSAPEYENGGIRAVLEGLALRGGEPITDNGQPIGLKQGGASISLEPAGQFELSGAPLPDLHATQAEFDAHFAELRAVAGPLGLGFAPLGFHPLASRAAMPWMPKGRYAIMRRYMPLVGSLGLDMMTRTCTVQVNLDYSSEADMRRKLRVGLLLQPLATALFANSPFTEGRPNGYQSYRAHIWTDTDNQRSGIPRLMLEDDFDFARYAAWAIDEVPMYFIYRQGRYIDGAGQSFRDFMAGRVPELAGEVATLGDFADHMTTVFTDVRLKRFLEMRGADAGSPAMMLAQSAFWVGLLYDEAALDAALALLRGVGHEAVTALRAAVPREGIEARLEAPWPVRTMRDLAKQAVAIARDGLVARARRDPGGRDESGFLDPLAAIAEGAPNQAQYWLSRYHDVWRGDAGRLLFEASV
jgi:glutamate--cysteine ligase